MDEPPSLSPTVIGLLLIMEGLGYLELLQLRTWIDTQLRHFPTPETTGWTSPDGDPSELGEANRSFWDHPH